MSTNYYAEWNLGPTIDTMAAVQVDFDPMLIRFHIGKWSSGVSLNGSVFESWAAWKHFLTQQNVRVIAEYGVEQDKELFIAEWDETTLEQRTRQHDWVVNNIGPTALHRNKGGYWLDDEGFTMSNGDFF